MNLLAKYTLFAEGCRGHLGKQLIANYQLDAGRDPQHYALGIKELWEIPAEKAVPERLSTLPAGRLATAHRGVFSTTPGIIRWSSG
jgi:flavin-dependent dehydrogenase